MRRLPNPWIVGPVIISAATGGAVGYFVTEASCSPDSCIAAAVSVALVVGIGSAIGVGIVVVLALKSIAEWRVHSEREILTETDESGPPGPPTC
jgi:hypothetical protein